MNRGTSLIAAIVAIVLSGGLLGVQSRAKQADTLEVAINLPLSGPIAAFMDPYPLGLKMGLEEGGAALKLPTPYFSLDVQDNAGKPSQAISVMQRQKLNGFDVYISGSTEMTMAIIDEVDATKKPHFLITFDAYMTGEGPDRLRILPNYKLEGPLWVEYAKRRGAKRIFMLTLNNAPIEEEFTKIVERGITALGAEFRRERFEWTGSDYRVLALKAQKYKPDLIMVNGYSVHLYPAIGALRALGLVKDHNTIAALDFGDLLYNDTPKAELLDVAFVCPLFEIPGAVPDSADWRKRYHARTGKRPSYVAAYAYDSGRMLAAAYAKNPQPTKADLVATLPMEGVSGTVAVDGKGDLASTLTIAAVRQDGTVQELR
jgi:ABC-type branched-subunit amino acid transport system substrate-binding protein